MRIILSWLKEFIDVTNTPDEIARLLTMAGVEVDNWTTFGALSSEIVVATVLESHKHPNADKLNIALVFDGQNNYQVVCGAPNCRAGIKTAFARVGATLKDAQGEFTIKQSQLRGVTSNGMLCSAHELGLSEDANQIIELSLDSVEGTRLKDMYADVIFDISLTPNLNYCGSVMGIARELACQINKSMHLPSINLQTTSIKTEKTLAIKVLDPQACPRYTCRRLQNVTVKQSPEWLRRRLEMSGLRSINHVVDVTNYVLLEMGHPLHAFDYAKIQGAICVRSAQNNEVLQTLDGKNRILDDSMLVISDNEKALAIAGVMGGIESAVNDNTHDIILEAAYFDSTSIRRTSKKLALQTDASKRFERGTDPNQLKLALDRAAQLIQEIGGGQILEEIYENATRQFPQLITTCRLSRINRLLGITFSRDEVENIFSKLDFKHAWDGNDIFTVHVPTYRNDIIGEVDLIEEIARIYGYENIAKQKNIRYQASLLPNAPIYQFEAFVRTQAVAAGLQEFVTCDLVGPLTLDVVYDSATLKDDFIKILNPTSVEQSILRTSLLPSLLQVLKHNSNHQMHDISGFEIGHVHFRDGEQYKEQSVLGLVLCGKAAAPYWADHDRCYDFFDLKGIIENLLRELGIEQVIFKNLDLPTFHCGRQASVYVGALEIGSFGEVHPSIQRRLDVPQRILFGEFNLKDLSEVAKSLQRVAPLTLYPASDRDWTFTVSSLVTFEQINNAIPYKQLPLLENVSLKAVYQSDKLDMNSKNITLHCIYRDHHKTILQADVEAQHALLQEVVLKELSKMLKQTA